MPKISQTKYWKSDTIPNFKREKVMKVKIELTVDINAESWIENYGIESSEVRDDVKGYCKNILLSQLEIIDVLESKNGTKSI
tara:strand:+ start:2914 stop:3159 length:246 start_codon:yes stop_codon:yes gene_type:complete